MGEVFITRTINVTPKTTVVRNGKSETEVTNNRRVRSKYCTVEASYWQTRSIIAA